MATEILFGAKVVTTSEPPHLMQVMIGHDSDGRGEIQAANPPPDGYSVARVCVSENRWKTEGLLAKKQISTICNSCICVILGGVPAKNQQSLLITPFLAVQEIFKVGVVPDIHLRPVVQPGSFEVFVVHLKSEGVDQMQPYLSSPAQASDVPCVVRDFRLVEGYVKCRVFDNPVFHLSDVASHWPHLIRGYVILSNLNNAHPLSAP